MASLAVEAFLAFDGLHAEVLATGLASIVKLSDFVSDFFFIKDLVGLERSMQEDGNVTTTTNGTSLRRFLAIDDDLWDTSNIPTYYYDETTEEASTFAPFASSINSLEADTTADTTSDVPERWLPVRTYIFLASLFTVCGILFDLVMAYTAYLEHQEKKAQEKEQQKPVSEVFWEEGIASNNFWRKVSDSFFESDASKHEEYWVWWRHLNVVIEEIPQLILLIVFYVDWSRVYVAEKEAGNQDDYWEKTKASIFVSAAITTMLLVKITIGYILFRRSKRQMEEERQMKKSASIYAISTSMGDLEKGTSNKPKQDSSGSNGNNSSKKKQQQSKGKGKVGNVFFSKSTDTAGSDDDGSISAFFSGLKEEKYKQNGKSKEKSDATSAKKDAISKKDKEIESTKLALFGTGATASSAPAEKAKTKATTNTRTAKKEGTSTNKAANNKAVKDKKKGSNNKPVANSSIFPSMWVVSDPEDDKGVVSSPICCGL